MSPCALPEPDTIDALGVRRGVVEELAVKCLYSEGEITVFQFAQRMHVSLSVGEELFQWFRREQLCEVKGMTGGMHRIAATSEGKARALEAFARSYYSGPCPVALNDYASVVARQTVRSAEILPCYLEKAFEHLVLPAGMLEQLGTAVVSGRSLFLYGPPGTGKTVIAQALPRIYPDEVWLPYAIEVDGQIVSVYDPGTHEALENGTPLDTDARWIRCRRPRVIVGGELTMEMLDLQFNTSTRFYAAPLQLKANNGVFVVDDFGRQRIRPEELLNRWTVPLDRRIDFLTLGGGRKFDIPFDVLVVFATNVDPATLADEAFLRRIQTKIHVGYVQPEHFHEIFRRTCERYELNYDANVVTALIDLLGLLNQPLRACHPRDIIEQIVWAARYRQKAAVLDWPNVEQACRNYFIGSQNGAEREVCSRTGCQTTDSMPRLDPKPCE